MKKVFKEVASLDRRCYDVYGLSEDVLMENASRAVVDAIRTYSYQKPKVLFVCGPGNNGGDGICAARMLFGSEFDVLLYVPFGVKSKMAKLQLQRAKNIGLSEIDEIQKADIYIDALFGSGLDRPLDAKSNKIVHYLNGCEGVKIACDIPSGILNDGSLSEVCFKADITVTMGALKESLFAENSKALVGEITVADLGVSRTLFESESTIFVLQKSDMKLPHRTNPSHHKGDFGHVGVLCGKKEGAGILAASAAFHFGAGLVSLVSEHEFVAPVYLMRTNQLPQKCNVVIAGMGLGNVMDDAMLYDCLLSHPHDLVIDADLFYENILREIIEAKKNIVLTPHPKEFCALYKTLGLGEVSVVEVQKERLRYAREFSKKFPNVVLVLKGANTVIAQNGVGYINPLGSVKLAKGGSGDVLAGMIGSLLAQNYSPLEAALSASLAHALAASESTCNTYALNPEDIIEGIKCL